MSTPPNLDDLRRLRADALSAGIGSGRWIKAATALMDAFPAIYDTAKAMNEDVARYRWLRNQAVNFGGHDDGQPAPWAVLGTRAEDAEPCQGEALDKAVDAARSAA